MLGLLNNLSLVNRDHPLATGLVSWYLALPQFASGPTWQDLGQAQNTGVLNGSTWAASVRPGGFGAAMSFDGTDDYVAGTAVLGPVGVVPMSCSCWCLSNNLTGYATPYFYGNSVAGRGVIIAQSGASNDGTILIGVVGSNILTSTGKLVVNVWTHLTVTSDAVNTKLYINGVLDSTVATALNPQATLQRIGSYVGSQFWSGGVDDARLYWYCLPPSLVRELYDNSAQGCPGLLTEARPYLWNAPIPPVLIPAFRNEVVAGPPMRGPWFRAFPVPQPVVPVQLAPPANPQPYPETRLGPPMPSPWFKLQTPPIHIQAPPPALVPQSYAAEVRNGPPLRGAPWLQLLPVPTALYQAPFIVPVVTTYAPEIHGGPPIPGSPWFKNPVAAPTDPGAKPVPLPPPVGHGKGHNVTLIQRDPTQLQPLRRNTEIMATIINSLVGQGLLVQTGPSSWTLAGTTSGLTGVFP